MRERVNGYSIGGVALFLVTLIFIFGWKITSILDLISLSSLGLLLATFVLGRAGLPPPALTMCLLLVLGVVYSCFASILGGGADPQLALREIRALLNFLGAAALCVLFSSVYGREQLARVIPVFIFSALSLHGALMLAMYLSTPLRESIYSVVNTYDYVNLNSPFLIGWRVPGLTYGMAQTSTLQMFGLLLAPLVYGEVRGRRVAPFVFWLAVVALLVSIFLTGRSGLVLAAVLVPLQFVVRRRRSMVRGESRDRRRLFAPILIGALAVSATYFLAQDDASREKVQYQMIWAGKILDVAMSAGQSDEVEAIAKMYIAPTNPVAMLIGGEGLGRGDLGNIPSDVGYVRLVHAAGFVGLIMLMLPLLYGLLFVVRARTVDFDLRLVTGLMLASTLLLNFKELALMTRNQWSVQCLCLAAIFLLACEAGEYSSQSGRAPSVRMATK
jgi:hypothetical protein